MIFTAASFTVTAVGTAISVLGFISESEDAGSRYVRAGWLLLVILGVAYVIGMAALLAPDNPLLMALPQPTLLVTTLLLGVGLAGTLTSASLLRQRRAAAPGRANRWAAWGRIGLVVIPSLTVVSLIVWL
jgi:hypothetical protein